MGFRRGFKTSHTNSGYYYRVMGYLRMGYLRVDCSTRSFSILLGRPPFRVTYCRSRYRQRQENGVHSYTHVPEIVELHVTLLFTFGLAWPSRRTRIVSRNQGQNLIPISGRSARRSDRQGPRFLIPHTVLRLRSPRQST